MSGLDSSTRRRAVGLSAARVAHQERRSAAASFNATSRSNNSNNAGGNILLQSGTWNSQMLLESSIRSRNLTDGGTTPTPLPTSAARTPMEGSYRTTPVPGDDLGRTVGAASSNLQGPTATDVLQDLQQQKKEKYKEGLFSQTVQRPRALQRTLPLSFVEQHYDQQRTRSRTVFDFVLFIPLLFVAANLFYVRSTEANAMYYSAAVKSRLCDTLVPPLPPAYNLTNDPLAALRPSGYPLQFDNIMDSTDWHQWFQLVVIPALYDPLSPTKRATSRDSVPVGQSIMATAMRVRVLRTSPDSCDLDIQDYIDPSVYRMSTSTTTGASSSSSNGSSWGSDVFFSCFGPFKESTQEKQAVFEVPGYMDALRYSDERCDNESLVEGSLTYRSAMYLDAYPCGGYHIDFSEDLSYNEAMQLAQAMQVAQVRADDNSSQWNLIQSPGERRLISDAASRALIVEVFFYHTALSVFLSVKLVAEITEGGAWATSRSFIPVILRPTNGYTVAEVVSDLVLLGLVIFFSIEFVLDVLGIFVSWLRTRSLRQKARRTLQNTVDPAIRKRLKQQIRQAEQFFVPTPDRYWLDPLSSGPRSVPIWGMLMDAAMLGLLIVSLLFSFIVASLMTAHLNDGTLTVPQREPRRGSYNVLLSSATYLDDSSLILGGFSLIFLWLKFIRFFHLSPRLSILTRTLAAAGPSIAGVLVMFIFFVIAFAQAGVVLFGVSVAGYRSLPIAISTCMLSLMGDFDYDALSESKQHPALVFFYFWIFMILGLFVLLNFITAVISGALDTERHRVRVDPVVVSIGRFFKSKIFSCSGHVRRIKLYLRCVRGFRTLNPNAPLNRICAHLENARTVTFQHLRRVEQQTSSTFNNSNSDNIPRRGAAASSGGMMTDAAPSSSSKDLFDPMVGIDYILEAIGREDTDVLLEFVQDTFVEAVAQFDLLRPDEATEDHNELLDTVGEVVEEKVKEKWDMSIARSYAAKVNRLRKRDDKAVEYETTIQQQTQGHHHVSMRARSAKDELFHTPLDRRWTKAVQLLAEADHVFASPGRDVRSVVAQLQDAAEEGLLDLHHHAAPTTTGGEVVVVRSGGKEDDAASPVECTPDKKQKMEGAQKRKQQEDALKDTDDYQGGAPLEAPTLELIQQRLDALLEAAKAVQAAKWK